MQRVHKKRGFTLIETVVTVGIVAALAAVVVPQVMRQFDTADPARMQNDLKNIQTAIETFRLNTKVVPGDLEDLANAITGTADSSVSQTTLPLFTVSQVGLWKGPYVDFVVIENAVTEANRPTGFGAKMQDGLVCYNSASNARGTSIGVAASASPCPAGAGQKFLAVQITGLAASSSDPAFLALNTLFDGDTEPTPDQTGRVRLQVDGSTTGGSTALNTSVVYFLAVPLN